MAVAEVDIAEDFVATYFYRGPLTECVVIDTNTGLFAKGYAKLNPIDVYDKDFGRYLSVLRASQRLSRKLEKKAIRDLG